ncbi:phage baseplate upper protein [Enterococcus sp. AZ192]|uniref:phage baseplate upper protein n=1 Tax=unclassified Enterococcus TaxID=2608891 RepID=UPI003D2C6F65
MSIVYPIFLSITQPNDNIPTMVIRQFDEGTQVLDVTITEHGKPKDISNLIPFFCVKQGHHAGLGLSEQKVTKIIDAKKGKIQYTLTNYDMQSVGENTAYFSFRELQKDLSWRQQFSTRDFAYQVKESIYEDGIKDSNYIWTFEEILRYFTEWVKTCQEIYDDWYLVAQAELQRIIKEFQGWITSNQERFDQWTAVQRAAFDEWFASIKTILDENAAGNLLNLIEELKQSHFTLKSGETGILRTIRDDKFSLNHGMTKVGTVPHKKEASALVIAEIDSQKQDTFFLRKVGSV